MYLLPRTKDSVLFKAVTAIGNAFAGRGGEILALCWSDVIRVVDAEGNVSFKVKYQRLKRQTSNSTDSEYALLICQDGVRAVEDYMSCFPVPGRQLAENKAVSYSRYTMLCTALTSLPPIETLLATAEYDADWRHPRYLEGLQRWEDGHRQHGEADRWRARSPGA
jgi:hypothetical protein